MGDITDFASLLAKLVIILSVVLMAAVAMLFPERLFAISPTMIFLIVPLFLFTVLLDLAGMLRRH